MLFSDIEEGTLIDRLFTHTGKIKNIFLGLLSISSDMIRGNRMNTSIATTVKLVSQLLTRFGFDKKKSKKNEMLTFRHSNVPHLRTFVSIIESYSFYSKFLEFVIDFQSFGS